MSGLTRDSGLSPVSCLQIKEECKYLTSAKVGDSSTPFAATSAASADIEKRFNGAITWVASPAVICMGHCTICLDRCWMVCHNNKMI